MGSESAQSRKELLVTELSKLHLNLRHDSRLCSSFIYNQLGEGWDINRVVQECATMHWLFSFTDYAFRCREAYAYFSTIFNSGRQVHDFMKINVQPYIKVQTIQFYGGIPTHWPWIPPTEGQIQDIQTPDIQTPDDQTPDVQTPDVQNNKENKDPGMNSSSSDSSNSLSSNSNSNSTSTSTSTSNNGWLVVDD